jgi:hypothetical protein
MVGVVVPLGIDVTIIVGVMVACVFSSGFEVDFWPNKNAPLIKTIITINPKRINGHLGRGFKAILVGSASG